MALISISQLNNSFIRDIEKDEINIIKGGFALFDPDQFPDLEAVKGAVITEDLLLNPIQALDDDQFVPIVDTFVPPVVEQPSTPSFTPPGRLF